MLVGNFQKQKTLKDTKRPLKRVKNGFHKNKTTWRNGIYHLNPKTYQELLSKFADFNHKRYDEDTLYFYSWVYITPIPTKKNQSILLEWSTTKCMLFPGKEGRETKITENKIFYWYMSSKKRNKAIYCTCESHDQKTLSMGFTCFCTNFLAILTLHIIIALFKQP